MIPTQKTSGNRRFHNSMSHNRIIRVTLIVIVLSSVLLLSGCIVNRLYILQQQAKHTDDYFNFEFMASAIRLEFKSPVLIPGDVSFLTGRHPTRTTQKSPTVTHWIYELRKKKTDTTVYPPSEYDLNIEFVFNNDALRYILFPKKIGELYTEDTTLRLMARTEHSRYNPLKNELTIDATHHVVKNKADLPTPEFLQKNLGIPFSSTATTQSITYTYRYELIQPETEKQQKNSSKDAWLEFSFDSITRHNIATSGKLLGPKISVLFN